MNVREYLHSLLRVTFEAARWDFISSISRVRKGLRGELLKQPGVLSTADCEDTGDGDEENGGAKNIEY